MNRKLTDRQAAELKGLLLRRKAIVKELAFFRSMIDRLAAEREDLSLKRLAKRFGIHWRGVARVGQSYDEVPPEPPRAKRLAGQRLRVGEDGALERICRRCLEWFPATTDHFFRQPSEVDGLHRYCKGCYKER